GDRLCIFQQAPPGIVLHANIPTQLVAVIDELPDQNPKVLTGNTWNAAVIRAVAAWAVARGAFLEQLRTALEIGLRAHGALELGSRRRCSRSGQRREKQRQEDVDGEDKPGRAPDHPVTITWLTKPVGFTTSKSQSVRCRTSVAVPPLGSSARGRAATPTTRID